VNAAVRYKKGMQHRHFPGAGGVVIEGGAYIGYKAVRFAEIVGAAGKVIAIEIGRQNYELMCRNIHANNMTSIITPVHCGIWKERGRMEAAFEHSNYYHLATPEEHEFMTRRESVPTETLDDIIDAHNLNIVDFLNIQTNGAELEAIEGLDRRLDSVKIIRTAAYYTRDGVPQTDAVMELLQKKGCTILMRAKAGQIIAATRRFAGEFRDSRGDKRSKALA
jgi:FkbM family methyltransferase